MTGPRALRIAYAAQVPVPSHRAYGVHVMHMCKAFAELGHETTLYTMEPSFEVPDLHGYYGMAPTFGVDHVPMSSLRGVSGPMFGREIVKRAVRAGTDLVYSRHIYAAAAARLTGLPVIYEAHMPVSNVIHRQLLARMLRQKNRFALVTITAALREQYLQDIPGLKADDILVAHDAADLPMAVAPADPKRPGAFVVGYVGNLYPGKGIEIILEIARLLPDLSFHIVGGRAEDLARWTSQNPPANIRFFGQVPHGDLQRYFDDMDVLLLPLQNKVSPDGGSGDIARWTSPMKMFEYMAQGKPIIASDLPVLQEVLRDGENALIIPAADAKAWGAAIRGLSADEACAEQLGKQARMTLERDHTWLARSETALLWARGRLHLGQSYRGAEQV